MRNLLLAVITLGCLISGTVLVLHEVEKRHANRPLELNRSRAGGGVRTPLFPHSKAGEPQKKDLRKTPDRTAASIFKLESGANAVISLPHVVLLAQPDDSAKQVTLLYRGNKINITGKAVSNFYPCTVFNTSGFVPATAIEQFSCKEHQKYKTAIPGQGEENPDKALTAVVRALHRGNILQLVRMIFRKIKITLTGYPMGPFHTTKGTLRNISRGRNLDSRPYSRGITLGNLISFACKYLPQGSVSLKSNQKSFTWPEEARFRISFQKKGRRWFLNALLIDREPRL